MDLKYICSCLVHQMFKSSSLQQDKDVNNEMYKNPIKLYF